MTTFWGPISPFVNSYESWKPGWSYYLVEPWNVVTSLLMLGVGLIYASSSRTQVVRQAYGILAYAGLMSAFQHTTMWRVALWLDYSGVLLNGAYFLFHQMYHSLTLPILGCGLTSVVIAGLDKYQLLPWELPWKFPPHSLWHLGMTLSAHLLFQVVDSK